MNFSSKKTQLTSVFDNSTFSTISLQAKDKYLKTKRESRDIFKFKQFVYDKTNNKNISLNILYNFIQDTSDFFFLNSDLAVLQCTVPH